MPSSTKYNPGDVVYVRFTFTAQIGSKRRPAIILSVPAYHASRLDAIMMPLTTQHGGHFGDAPLSDWRSAGLPAPSNLKAVLQTIPRDVIESKIGTLISADLDLVRATIKTIVGLS